MILRFIQQTFVKSPLCSATGDLVINRTNKMLFSWSLCSVWEEAGKNNSVNKENGLTMGTNQVIKTK